MAIEITIPRLGWSMEEGIFASWIKKEGEKVAIGDPLFVLEGEKSLQEIESLDNGILRILPSSPKTGEIVKVGQLIGYLSEANETLPASPAQSASSGPAAPPPPVPAAVETPPPAPVPKELPLVPKPASQPVAASTPPVAASTPPVAAPSTPRARRAAAELGVNVAELRGTGRDGRVRERDVRSAPPKVTQPITSVAANEAPKLEGLPITNLRRTIAERMVSSLANTAPVTLNCVVNATKLVALRTELKKAADGASIASYNDMLVKLTASALLRFPIVASQWQNDQITLPSAINIGIAVDTEYGLLVPVIRNVPDLSLPELASTSRSLIAAAQSRKIKPEDLQGGVFTITNLGGLGVDSFTPIINFPEVAILGVGAIRRVPVVLEDGTLGAGDQITLSMTFDHRVIDGAPAARFLQAVSNGIENPVAWLLGYSPAAGSSTKS